MRRLALQLLLLLLASRAASAQETGLRVASIGEDDRGRDHDPYGSPIDRSDGVSVYSNNNVNLGNFGSGLGGSSSSDDPKLMGPNVCTKQEP